MCDSMLLLLYRIEGKSEQSVSLIKEPSIRYRGWKVWESRKFTERSSKIKNRTVHFFTFLPLFYVKAGRCAPGESPGLRNTKNNTRHRGVRNALAKPRLND